MIRRLPQSAGYLLVGVALLAGSRVAAQPSHGPAPTTAYRALLDEYCVTCHNEALVDGTGESRTALVSQLRAVDLTLDTLDLMRVGEEPAHWEQVVRKLRAGLMPPAGRPRPDDASLDAFRAWLEAELDETAAARPDPGRTATFHRLNRAEYRNAVRDLLAVEIEVDDFLPADDASFGFDNIGGALRMSQSLLERYLVAGRSISRLAVGSPPPAAVSDTFRAAQDEQQHERAQGLPFGTRGGMLVRYQFPVDADYDIRIELNGNRGLREEHRLELTVDGEPVEEVTLGPAPADDQPNPYITGSILDLRLPVDAGQRDVGVAFSRNPTVLVEQVRERFQKPAHLRKYRRSRGRDAVREQRDHFRSTRSAWAGGDTQSRPYLRLPADRRRGGVGMRPNHSVHPGPPSLSSAGDGRGARGAARVLSDGPDRWWEL